MDQQEPFCVCIYYGITEFRWGGSYKCTGHNRVKGHVWGEGGTAMMQIIARLTGQVVGEGLYECTGHNGVKGNVWGGGGYHNNANYCGIDRPGCGGVCTNVLDTME